MSENVSLEHLSDNDATSPPECNYAFAKAQMQYMQQQQMMMAPNGYIPFVVPSPYQMMMQQHSYFKNKDQESNEDSEGSSPLNLKDQKIEEHDNIYQNPPGHDASKNSESNVASSTSPQVTASPDLGSTTFGTNFASFNQHHNQFETFRPDVPPPPKRPLTPYMRFSKCMWQQVKSDNPGLSVCEIGATIGRMWRELSTEEKQRHNDDFTLDKVRYDSELKQYLKETGLKSRDLVKIRAKNKAATKGTRKPVQSPNSSFFKARNVSPTVTEFQGVGNSHFGQSFIPLSTSFGMPMGMLPGFPQMWAGQQYSSQQMFASVQLAQQQSLYLNSPDTISGSSLTTEHL